MINEVSEFVNENIVHHFRGSEKQAHRNNQVAMVRTMPPKAGGVFHFYAAKWLFEIAVVEFVNALGNNRQKKLAKTFCNEV